MNDREEALLHCQLLRMARGEEEALEALYHTLAPWVFALIHRILKNPEVAKEVLQDTFLRVYQQAWVVSRVMCNRTLPTSPFRG
ncbi:RNA polymerase sigma factor, partial [Thermus antranikianii]